MLVVVRIKIASRKVRKGTLRIYFCTFAFLCDLRVRNIRIYSSASPARVRARTQRIASPRSDVAYSSAGKGRSDRALTLVAETDADVRTIYWFAGREFIGAAKRNAPLDWQPRPGKYKIVALDDHGRSDTRAVACTE